MEMTKERAYEMIKELLAAEEKNDTLYLTTRERSEFQQIVEDAFNEPAKNVVCTVASHGTNHRSLARPNCMVSVQTKNGELKAYVGGDPGYPSIDIMLRPSDDSEEEINIAFAESVDGCGIRCAIYGDASNEEPTHWEYVQGIEEIKKETNDVER